MTLNKYIILISIILSGVSSTMILPVIAPLSQMFHLSVSQGGWILSIGSLAMVVAAPLWGYCSDRFGRKFSFLLGFTGLAVGYGAFALVIDNASQTAWVPANLFLALASARLLTGIFLPAVPSAAQALMADITTPQNRAKGMAIIGTGNGIGMIIGPALAGYIALFGLQWPFYFGALLCTAAMAMVLTLLPKSKIDVHPTARKTGLFSMKLLPWSVSGILIGTTISILQILGGYYLLDVIALQDSETASTLAQALFLVGVAMLITQIGVIRLFSIPPKMMVLVGLSMWIISLLILAFPINLPLFMTSYTLFGVGAGFLMPGTMAGMSMAVGQERQGAVGGLFSFTFGIGLIIGPVLGTNLYASNHAAPFYFLATLCAAKGLLLLKQRIPLAQGTAS